MRYILEGRICEGTVRRFKFNFKKFYEHAETMDVFECRQDKPCNTVLVEGCLESTVQYLLLLPF